MRARDFYWFVCARDRAWMMSTRARAQPTPNRPSSRAHVFGLAMAMAIGDGDGDRARRVGGGGGGERRWTDDGEVDERRRLGERVRGRGGGRARGGGGVRGGARGVGEFVRECGCIFSAGARAVADEMDEMGEGASEESTMGEGTIEDGDRGRERVEGRGGGEQSSITGESASDDARREWTPLEYISEVFEVRCIDEKQAKVTPVNQDGHGYTIRGYSARQVSEYGVQSGSKRLSYNRDEERDEQVLNMIATSRGVRPAKLKDLSLHSKSSQQDDVEVIHLERQQSHSLGREVPRRRLVWTKALHKRFAKAVDTLGLDSAVPKAIMELMQVPGLTRENIASHLQKYRTQMRDAVQP